MTDRTCAVLESRGLLALTGAGVRDFLQGLITNDVRRLTPERALYASLLTAQGKVLHDFFVAETTLDEGPAVVLDVEGARAADLVRRLTMYKLRAEVAIHDLTGRYGVAALFGEGTAAALGLDAAEGCARAAAGGIVFVDPRLVALGARAIVPAQALDGLAAAHGFGRGTAEDYDRLRLAAGVPDGSRDFLVEKSFPLECDFDELHAIAYDKGCYIGQELTARTHNRGTIKKRLFPVAVEGPLPPPGAAIEHAGRPAGEMRSGRDGRGIALLRIDDVKAARDSGEAFTAGEATVRPIVPGWMPV